MEGTGVGTEDLSFRTVRTVFFFFFLDSHEHTRTVSHLSPSQSLPGLLISLHGSSCNHRLQAMWRGEEGQADSEEKKIHAYISKYISERVLFYLMLLCWGLGGYTRHVLCLILPFANNPPIGDSKQRNSIRTFIFSLHVCCYFAINVLPHFLYGFSFFFFFL